MIWNKHLNNDMKNLTWLCFQMSLKSTKLRNVFMWKTHIKIYIIVCIYVDGMLILDNNDHMIKFTKKMLNNKFNIKDLGVVDVTLIIKITMIFNGLELS
jgi:hypothetical protein